jgi:hypothetical protein
MTDPTATKERGKGSCPQVAQDPRKTPVTCSACGSKGSELGEITIKALLRPAALARRAENQHWFCSTPSCSVVYFGKKEKFARDDIIVPAFEKENDIECPVCYCFDVSESDIREELARTGKSTASIRIRALIRQNRCACELRHPSGSCCLGNVTALEHSIVRRS